jgi:aryl-alcohol dehydrogenase-like predicted oxidoreductase
MLQLGKSEVSVPPLAIGTMFWGTRVPRSSAHDLLDHALEAGACFIDTANNYAFWESGGLGDESETCLGEWIAARGPSGRDRLVLATKVGARPVKVGAGTDNALGLSRQAVLDQVADSLRRLRTTHVDVLYAHIDDTRTPLAETIGVFQEVVDRGWARTVAASNLTADRLDEAMTTIEGGAQYAALQNRFTFLPPAPGSDFGRQVLLDDAVQAACRRHHVTMVAYSTLLEGAYTRPERPFPPAYQRPGSAEALEVLTSVAKELDLDRGQAVLAWLAHRVTPIVPVVGVSRRLQLDSAIEAIGTPVPPEAIAALEEARAAAA